MNDQEHVNGLKGRKNAKRIAIITGVLFTFAMAAVLIVPSFIDWTHYRSDLENLAANISGRPVRIAGDVSLQLLPTPAISASDVRIANVESGKADYMARFARLDAVLSPLSLLRGKVRARRLEIIRPVIALERTETGIANWQYDQNEGRDGLSSRPFQIDDFRIKDGEITYMNAVSGQSHRLSSVNARISAQSQSGPFQANGDLDLEGVPIGFSVDLDRMEAGKAVRIRFESTMRDMQASLSGWFRYHDDGSETATEYRLNISSAAESFSAVTNDATQILRREAPILPKTLARPYRLEAELHRDAHASWAAENIAMHFENSKITGNVGSDAPNRPIKATFHADRLSLDDLLNDVDRWWPKALPRMLADLDFTLTADTIAYKEGLVRQAKIAAASRDGTVKLDRLSALLPGTASLEFMGSDKPDTADKRLFHGSLSFQASRFTDFLNWLEVPHHLPAARYNAFTLQSGLSGELSRLSFKNSVLRFGADTAEGALSLNWKEGRLADIDAKMALGRIRLDDILTAKTPFSFLNSPHALQNHLNRWLADMAGRDVKAEISAEQIRHEAQELRDVALAFRTTESGFSLDKARFHLPGKIEVSGSFGFNREDDVWQVDATGTLHSDDLSRLIGTPILKGPNARLALKNGAIRLSGPLTSPRIDSSGLLFDGEYKITGPIQWEKSWYPDMFELDITYFHQALSRLGRTLDITPELPLSEDPLHLRLRANKRPGALEFHGIASALGSGTVRFDGETRLPLKGADMVLNIFGQHPDTNGLISAFIEGYTPTSKKLGESRLSMHLERSGNLIDLAIDHTDIGPATLTGSLQLDLGEERQALTGNLSFTSLPLSDFLPQSPARQSATDQTGRPRWSASRFHLDRLGAMDMDLRLKADTLTLSPYQLFTPVIRLQLDGEDLSVNLTEAKLFGGIVSAHSEIRLTPTPAIKTALLVKDADLRDALATFAGLEALQGRFSIDSAIQMRGNSQLALVSSLSGTADIKAKAGTIKGFDITSLQNGMEGTEDRGDIDHLLQRSLTAGTTAFQRFSHRLDLQNGRADFENITLPLAGGKLDISGELDLAAWSFNADGHIALADPEDAPDLGFAMGGSLSSPRGAFHDTALRQWLYARLQPKIIETLPYPKPGTLAPPDIVGSENADKDPFQPLDTITPPDNEDSGGPY